MYTQWTGQWSVFNPFNPLFSGGFSHVESDTISMGLLCSLCTLRDYR